MAGTWHDELTRVATQRGPALIGYAYLLSGDLARAEDLVQEALIRTWARPRRLEDDAAAEAYVRRTILNTFLDEYRRESVFRRKRHLVAVDDAGSAPDRRVRPPKTSWTCSVRWRP